MIAVSIAFVGFEAWRDTRRAERTFGARAGVVFAFGLIHGLGFAAVLADWLPAGAGRLVTLLGFHLGVEVGQLLVVALAVLLLWPWARRSWYAVRVVTPIAVLVTFTALYWAVQRLPV